jgi:malate dehydrogenase (oxaloacetate-decarboxylating)
VEDLLARARKPGEDALKLHSFYQGKLAVIPKCRIRGFEDFAVWYSPGVAAPCLDITQHPEKVFEHTNKGNFVAIVSDGSRVLGLGDIGPHAALPVMEGKAILFKYLGGVDAFPLCIGTKNPAEIIQICKWLEPTFGGINLEDIAKPKCFDILDRLRAEMTIPVWHDDQQGTATVTVAALLNALKVVGKSKEQAKISLIGVGAASVAVARLLFAAGFPPRNLIMADTKGILHEGREDLATSGNEVKRRLSEITNGEIRIGGIFEAMKGTDACVAFSASGPGIIKAEWVSAMSPPAVVFACANPIPEIWPWEAKAAGAAIVATGRSDFPNQVNNSLVFPALFRGVLDVGARTITDEMCLAAAGELARCAEEKGLSENLILPRMDEWEVFPREAAAVGKMAMEQGVARRKLSGEELFGKACETIKRARDELTALMEKGLIPPAP